VLGADLGQVGHRRQAGGRLELPANVSALVQVPVASGDLAEHRVGPGTHEFTGHYQRL
jgi:hypothetical protein